MTDPHGSPPPPAPHSPPPGLPEPAAAPLPGSDEPVPPATRRAQRRLEARAALLLIFMALLIAISVLYLMWVRGAFEATQKLYLTADDSDGVVVGMDLTFSGFPIGRVSRIELAEQGTVRIHVDVPVKDAHWLRISSVFTLERGLVGAARLRAFKEAMRTGRLDIDEHLIVVAKSYSLAEGRRLADQILAVEPPPTALVAANDLLALGAYEAAAGLGYRIPVDLSVTGFNDMPLVERMTPPLTTVRIQHYELGVHAAQLLAKQLDQPHSPKIAMSLGVSLEVRGSTAAPRATTLRRATG